MCLLVLAWRHHQRHRLIFAGNRDEFHARPTAPADWWDQPAGLLAGRDLQAGGTWLGVTRRGRFAVVTNFRDMADSPPAAPSRGGLITDFAAWPDTTGTFVDALGRRAEQFAGFNLIFGDGQDLHYLSNRGAVTSPLPAGVYGLSNHRLDTPWPKLTRTRKRFEALIRADEIDIEALFSILTDREPAPDEQLPATGLSPELERALSAPFIVSPGYGTRSSTVVIADTDETLLVERRFDPTGAVAGEQRVRFAPGPQTNL